MKTVELISQDVLENMNVSENVQLVRKLRAHLLKTFDIWERAVMRGREEDSTEVMTWYQALLDLETHAFNEIPDVIAQYRNEV